MKSKWMSRHLTTALSITKSKIRITGWMISALIWLLLMNLSRKFNYKLLNINMVLKK